MSSSVRPSPQRIYPYLVYADAPAAIDFLCRAFGFEEQMRFAMPDGRIGHAEIAVDGYVIMLASACHEMGFSSPRLLPGVHSQVLVQVDDVDAHYERAKRAGATIATAPTNQHGQQMYRALELEGHRWIFAAPLESAARQEDKVDEER